MGPFANATDELFGDYTSDVVAKYTRNVFEGLRRLGREAVLSEGCSSPTCTQYNQTDMQKAITGSDLVVVCLGTGTPVEEEGRDRSTIDLPGQQLLLLKDAVASGKLLHTHSSTECFSPTTNCREILLFVIPQ